MRSLVVMVVAVGLAGAVRGDPPALDVSRFRPAPLTVRFEDLTVRLDAGGALPALREGRTAAIVLVGSGTVSFSPAVASERRQLQLFCGAPRLEERFDEADVRVPPDRFPALLPDGARRERTPDVSLVRRARRVLDDDESKDPFPGDPRADDFVAIVRTRRTGLIAFLRLSSEPEDLMMIDLDRNRRITLYPSLSHRKAFGLGYGDEYGDEYGLPYAVTHSDLDLTVDPGGPSLSGEARLSLKALRTLEAAPLRLDPAFEVAGVRSAGAPREFFRPPGSDRLWVRFDPPLPPGASADIEVRYAGRPQPQRLEGDGTERDGAPPPSDSGVLYSNRIWWYPQSPVHDHATANVRVRVPPGFTALASGIPLPSSGGAHGSLPPEQAFRVDPPVRYLALLVGRFAVVSDEPAVEGRPSIRIVAVPGRAAEARALAPDVRRIVDYFSSVVGDVPFPMLTVAVVDSRTPAAHAPAYLVIVGRPAGPAAFPLEDNPSYDREEASFQLAHEIAHQWWGQAVGWRNYRQQWLSEAFAQYAAALYVRHSRGEKAFERVLLWLARWARRAAGRGSVDLGVRAGIVTGEPWLFPAVVYDRGALALHALRQKVGDDAFFRGLRAYYRCRKFDRADTEDFRMAMEEASGADLREFFDFWVHGDAAPESFPLRP